MSKYIITINQLNYRVIIYILCYKVLSYSFGVSNTPLYSDHNSHAYRELKFIGVTATVIFNIVHIYICKEAVRVSLT